ncbi:hypothetical protein [Spirillospora sp. CA-294931]|uniref:hypothetical protein n=1 Tax=Spirillospora sp. CA-294931 TaxID=3240042 RepID=UPI003D8E6845
MRNIGSGQLDRVWIDAHVPPWRLVRAPGCVQAGRGLRCEAGPLAPNAAKTFVVRMVVPAEAESGFGFFDAAIRVKAGGREHTGPRVRMGVLVMRSR